MDPNGPTFSPDAQRTSRRMSRSPWCCHSRVQHGVPALAPKRSQVPASVLFCIYLFVLHFLYVIGICLVLGIIGAISTKYLGPDNEVEEVSEDIIKAEEAELMHTSNIQELDSRQVKKHDA